jgi:hypothetical protein
LRSCGALRGFGVELPAGQLRAFQLPVGLALAAVVVVQRDFAVLVERVRFGHFERRPPAAGWCRGRLRLAPLRRRWLGLFESVSLWDLRVNRHICGNLHPGTV